MTAKKWFYSILIMIIATLLLIGGCVFFVDPFFHYRAPRKDLFYRLFDERSQNDGITKNFEYDAILTGTSMAENFKTSQLDEGLNLNSVKVVYSGATYKEINDNLKVSFESGHNLKYVVRPLDYSLLLRDKDELRLDMGEYPVWLYNANPFDDVKYLLNKDVVSRYVLPAFLWKLRGKEAGHTDFDEYAYTGDINNYGKEYALAGRERFDSPETIMSATDDELNMLEGNIEQNVVSLAREHKDTTFVYFFPPYSMAYFGGLYEEGELDKFLELKKRAVEQILECDNIHLYSFSMHTDITTDLDRYRDMAHYNPEVNEEILGLLIEYEKDIEEGREDLPFDRITRDNAEEYLNAEKELLEDFDYNLLVG